MNKRIKLREIRLNEIKIRFIQISKNKKTGLLSQTYTDKCTCPMRCPYRKSGGCMSMSGHCRLHWDLVPEKGVLPEDLSQTIKNGIHTSIVRHNVAGDLATPGTDDIDEELLKTITQAYKENGITAFTYTHCEINDRNSRLIREAAENGMIINYSCETIEQVKTAKEQGCNAVLSVEKMSAPVVEKDGVVLIQCPETYKENVHCQNCGICWQKNRQAVVAFPLHGNKATQNKAKKAGFLTEQ